MDPKQKMMLMVSGGVAGLLLVVLAVLLVLQIDAMTLARASRDGAKEQLDTMYQLNPYPNEANLAIRKKDAEAYQVWTAQAYETLTHTQQGLNVPQGESPSQFQSRLTAKIDELNRHQNHQALEAAKNAGKPTAKKGTAVVTAPDVTFGFEKYKKGDIPEAANVPRLAEQFAAITLVSELLYKHGAFVISNVTREAFDEAKAAQEEAPTTSRRTNRRSRNAKKEAPVATVKGVTPVPELLRKDGVRCETYTIAFRATYKTLVDVLNAMMENQNVFFVINDVTITNPLNLQTLVDSNITRRKATLEASRKRAKTEEEAAAIAKEPLFKNAYRRIYDPKKVEPLDITMTFEVWSAPVLEKADSEADTTKEEE